MLLAFLFIYAVLVSCAEEDIYHPASDLSDIAPFLPRAILYYCYKFPLRDDGSLQAFDEHKDERGLVFFL
ncbi:unnamed protein product [Strongylus vulgaris]|uniref:Uncharacterized protein n=1 Tax=Strongylus vulgaris TaxID=40348 RepID=A0A3P7JKY3_STRVU|nr:unnamed protein product [Strongylus vulgaris]